METDNAAPGAPGIPARWTSSAKNGVGTALSDRSRVWFTLSHGILNEVYYPRIDEACIRDFGFIVTDGKDFFSEEKRDTDSVLESVADGVPAFTITSTCKRGRYRLRKRVFTDPDRDVLMQHIVFEALAGAPGDYRLFALVAPHLVNRGEHNSGWVGEYKGAPMLFAEGNGTALAVACSTPFISRSAGFVGASDGWQDLSRHFEMRWHYETARDGNVALTGEIDFTGNKDGVVVALGFGRRSEEAALKARASLSQGVDEALEKYAAGWRAWQATLLALPPVVNPGKSNLYRVSTAVLRTHEESAFAGGYIASLSIPWGFNKGADDLGGYHLVWPRDLVETAGGLLAAGAKDEVRQIIDYLRAIQESDGHWPQNCWLDGTSYWTGVQMDETALPILLVDLAWREKALTDDQARALWPMIGAAAAYIVTNGPVTGQDRWEEDGGYSPFTLAAEIAALLAAADLADFMGTAQQALYLRETADSWNAQIEHWIFATDTALAREVGVPGYYVRVAPPETADAASPLDGFVPIKNRPPESSRYRAALLVSPDALALVRFGLRAPDDPKILATIKVIDAQLKVDLPAGPCWRRY
ncbi:MAG: glycoside hydrolase family 15 protein, partial [Rhodospirillaceae bacterium]